MKSNNPHLAGGEKTLQFLDLKGLVNRKFETHCFFYPIHTSVHLLFCEKTSGDLRISA